MSSRLSRFLPPPRPKRNTIKNPSLLALIPITPKLVLSLLLITSLTFIAHNYLKALHQKELKTHTALSLELNNWIQKEQVLLTRLHQIKTTSPSHSITDFEHQPDFKKKWKKVKLLHIPIVTIEELPAESPALTSSQPVVFTEP